METVWCSVSRILALFLTEGGGEHLGTAPHKWPSVSARSDKIVRCAGGIRIVTGKIKMREERPTTAPICAPKTQYRLPCV
jgi:hypothetical protein